MRMLLASASPRRAELLAAAGYVFEVKSCTVDETPLPGEIPALYVARLAAAKAGALTDIASNNVILAADTCVVLDGDILGKPIDDADAAKMLGRLSGRSHEVLTGVSMRYANQCVGAVDRTVVHVATLQPAQVAWYVASGEPRDKAGAYGIQGLAARFIDRIEGSYSNVVGLPLAVVRRLLSELGFDGVQMSEIP